MPLSLLAGPFNIVSNEVGGDDLVPVKYQSWWYETPPGAAPDSAIPTLGLLLLADADGTYGGELYAVQLDGTAIRIGARRMPGFNVIQAFGWRLEDDSPLILNDDTWKPMQLPSTTPLDVDKDTRAREGFAVLADRVIWVRFGRIYTGGLDDDTTEDLEFEIDITSGKKGLIFPCDIRDGKSLWWICLPDLEGALYLYDANLKALVTGKATTFDGDVISAAYSRKHDVFIVTRRDETPDPDVDQIYVYANEYQADSISTPVFADLPKKGGTTTVSAQVQGALGEPCAGRIVKFTATVGEVVPETATTDETGTAEVTYRAPIATSMGETLTAELTE